jgi:hypothetical protein
MPSTQQEMQHLQELHARAIHQLSRKMSCIPAHVFPNGRKPTITDIYTANESAICIPSIPPELQLPSVLTHYDKLAAAKFTVDASQGATPINLALWYWGMDQTHSFSRKHRQMRYNIVMACIVRTSPDLSAHLPSSALDFADALINAWIWSVSQQDDFEAQAHFLGLWADGPWDVMLIGRKDRARMEVAARAMSQFVPKLDPLGGDIEYWEGLRYTSPWKLSTFGPAWAIRYIVDVEQLGKKIGEKGQEAEVEEALATGALEVCHVRSWSNTSAFEISLRV